MPGARGRRGAKHQTQPQPKVRLIPPNVKAISPKIKQDFDKGRAVMLTGGVADLLLTPYPGTVMVCDDPDASTNFSLAVPPGVNNNLAERRERLKTSVVPSHVTQVNFDSQMEQMLKVQQGFLKANPQVEEKYKLLKETQKPNPEMDGDFKELGNGTFSLCFANNQRVVFSKPTVMEMRLKEDGIQKFGCPMSRSPSLAFDDMQAKLKDDYMAPVKVETNSLVPWKSAEAEGVKPEVVEMGDKIGDQDQDKLNIQADGVAEDLYPD